MELIPELKENKKRKKTKYWKTAKLKKVSGGAGETRKGCELCGKIDEYESYYITIKFTDGAEILGRKKICMTCRDTHIRDYIKKNYPGRTVKTIYMDGPLY